VETSAAAITAGVAVVATGLTAFNTFCPNLPDVLADGASPTVRRAVDFGQNAASLATIAIGLVLAYVTRSPMPVVFGLVFAFGTAYVYEIAFRRTA